jgi:hypothetical protein
VVAVAVQQRALLAVQAVAVQAVAVELTERLAQQTRAAAVAVHTQAHQQQAEAASFT